MMSSAPILKRLMDLSEFRCVRCGAHKSLLAQSGTHLPEQAALKILRQAGWQVSKNPDHDLCPACVERDGAEWRAQHRRPPPAASNGHDVAEGPHHTDEPAIIDLYQRVNMLALLKWTDNENMYVATLVAMLSQLEQFLEAHYAELRRDHRVALTMVLKELLETAQLADLLTVPEPAPPATQSEPTILEWLESLK
jgi:hypothetical protein